MTPKTPLLAAAMALLAQPGHAADPASPDPVVVVTATLRSQSAAAAPAFMTVVSAEDIAKSPANSLGDLLRETVGVSNQTDSTGRDEIRIRGLAGKYTLMLLNGKRISSGGALWRGSDFDFSSVPLASIKRVEIVRGPMAALYGSDAIGGVINIITKQPVKQWQGSVSAELRHVASGEEGRQYRVGASAAGAVSENVSLSLNGEVYDREPWYQTSASDSTRPPRLEEKQSKNFFGSALVRLAENQTLDIDLGINHDKRPRALYFYAFYPQWNFESKDFREQEIRRDTYGLTHKGSWNWGSSTLMLNRESARIDDFNSRYDAPQQRRLKEDNTYVKAHASSELGIHALTAGVDLRRQEIRDGYTYQQTGGVSTDSRALFLEDELTLAPHWRLTLAGRLDDSNTFGSHFSPKSYLNYQASAGLTIKGGISRAFKAPDAYQLSPEYRVISCGGSCYLGGNPGLTPETSTNYEAGFELHRQGWNLTAVLFKNDVKDLIVATYDASVPARRWVNVARANTKGIELQGDLALSPAWALSGNLTHLKADYVDETGSAMRLDNRPENVGHVSIDWKPRAGLQASLAAHYTGKQYYEDSALPSYTRYDLALSAKPLAALTVRAGVKNLTDVNLEQKSSQFGFFELGRNYYLSATYMF